MEQVREINFLRWHVFRLNFLAGGALLAAIVLGAAPVLSEDQVLGPGDLLDISVMSRPELSRSYRVRLDGTISMHIVGSIPTSGRTPGELESLLESRLSEVFEGSTSATVEVSQFRPVIVGGEVAEPGSYAFLPGLDVGAALALAGGLPRFAAGGDVSAQMRVEAEAARHALLRSRMAVLLVEQARLEAERDGREALDLPAEAAAAIGAGGAEQLASAQATLLTLRDEQLALRVEAEDGRIALAGDEAAAFAERQALIRSQLEATLSELEGQEALAERGLALTQRLLDLRLSADTFRADELEAVALEAVARQKISDAEAGKRGAVSTRAGEVAERLAALDAELVEIRAELGSTSRFVRTFGGAGLSTSLTETETVFVIRRRGPEGVALIDAAEDTLLLPGDMLEISVRDVVPDSPAGAAPVSGEEG